MLCKRWRRSNLLLLFLLFLLFLVLLLLLPSVFWEFLLSHLSEHDRTTEIVPKVQKKKKKKKQAKCPRSVLVFNSWIFKVIISRSAAGGIDFSDRLVGSPSVSSSNSDIKKKYVLKGFFCTTCSVSDPRSVYFKARAEQHHIEIKKIKKKKTPTAV